MLNPLFCEHIKGHQAALESFAGKVFFVFVCVCVCFVLVWFWFFWGFFLVSLEIPWFGLLSHISSLRLSLGNSGPVLILRTNDAACASLPSPHYLVVDVNVSATSPSPFVVVVSRVFCWFFFPPIYVAL